VIFVGAALGKTIFRLFGKAGESAMLNMLIGTIVLSVVCGIPYVGQLIWFLAAAIGLGALLLWFRTRNMAVRSPERAILEPPPPSSGEP
jgi:4-hydroxybenzoate polyprenyltransferase